MLRSESGRHATRDGPQAGGLRGGGRAVAEPGRGFRGVRDPAWTSYTRKAFSTGSFGWYRNGKTTVMVDGKAVSVQIGMNLTIVGSKEAPRD